MRFSRSLLLATLWPFLLHAQSGWDELAGRPLEALLATEVSSVLKHPSGLVDAPAAVTVLRRDDIERLGAATLPDLLRVVPGLAVAQIDGNKWSVASRGFGGFFSTKLLVLIDGRSIYNSTFAGVFWDAYDIPLDDIARIEVIRGPAGVLWGSNAVNGVINIVTRSAHETQGTRLATAAGNIERQQVELRHGGSGEAAAWRLYAKTRERGDLRLPGDESPGDSTRSERVGFRIDSAVGGADSWMLGGDAYRGRSGGAANPLPTTDELSGEHLLARLERRPTATSSLQLQAYADHSWRRDVASGSVLDETVFNLDFQHDVELSPAHRLTWGSGWRQYRFASTGSGKLAFVPASRISAVGNVFIQDEWSLLPRELLLVAGLRAEHLPEHGVQWQPNLRLAWTPSDTQTFWLASGKAARAPNKVDTSLRYNGAFGSTGPASVVGNPGFLPEEIVSLEAGWRTRIGPRLASDLAIYRNRYRRLDSIEYVPATGQVSYFNHGRGSTEGLEWSLDWQASEDWQLRGGLTFYREDLSFAQPPASSAAVLALQDSFPNRQMFVRSLWDISAAHRLDLTVRGVGPLKRDHVPGYVTADLRWNWKLDRRLEFSLIGRNLGGPAHREIGDQPFFQETYSRREVIGILSCQF